jgi:hypothetical protein
VLRDEQAARAEGFPHHVYSLHSTHQFVEPQARHATTGGTGISLRNEYFVLAYPYELNILYWTVPAD